MGILLRVANFLVHKLLGVLLIVLVGLGGWALWLYYQDEVSGHIEREGLVERLRMEAAELDARLTEVRERVRGLHEEAAAQRERLRRLEVIIGTLQELHNWWQRFFGDPEQIRRNEEQMERARRDRRESLDHLDQAVREIEDLRAEAEGLENELYARRMRLKEEEERNSWIIYYQTRAWEAARKPVMIAVAVFIFGPTLWKIVMYFAWAPLLSRGRPVRLREAGPREIPEVGRSGVSADVELWPGEAAWVKEKYLQASDEALARKTRFVMDWTIPFTSLACGLVELVELAHPGEGSSYRLTCSNQEDTHTELCLVVLPAGASMILRPSFIAALIKPLDGPLRIHRHWRIFTLQSWITWQFRYFEFEGPLKLVVAGSRGVRAEPLSMDESSRRTNQDATIGFTPALAYRSVRAETFWAYYRGANPLFDDLFRGRGVFLCQEISAAGAASAARRFWARLWDGFLRVFGL